MKYFVGSKERGTSGDERYIEFQTLDATKEFWDETSLYMSFETAESLKLGSFIEYCVYEDILFDCESISSQDWSRVLDEAKLFDEKLYEAICELRIWLEKQFEDANHNVYLIWEAERTHARLRDKCE